MDNKQPNTSALKYGILCHFYTCAASPSLFLPKLKGLMFINLMGTSVWFPNCYVGSFSEVVSF